MEVTLIAAITTDGFIGQTSTSSSFDWTSTEDKQFYVSQLKLSDAIVMGRTSFNTFSRYPKNSSWYIYTSQPEAFVNPKPAVISAEGTNETPQALIERLRAAGKQRVLIAGGSSIYHQFMAAGVVTQLLLTVEPVVFGQGISLFNQAFEPIVQLKLDGVEQLSSQTIVLSYTVRAVE
jgi:dihydrofolate reductase